MRGDVGPKTFPFILTRRDDQRGGPKRAQEGDKSHRTRGPTATRNNFDRLRLKCDDERIRLGLGKIGNS